MGSKINYSTQHIVSKQQLKSNGAANQTNLETASLDSILDELEEWEAFLKAEPELIHKLRSFDEAAKPSHKPLSPARPRGPSL